MSGLVEGAPYQGYAYAYPHKTAYRALSPPRPLQGVWAQEPRDAVFLYLHVPYCEMRCGFCNLFTMVDGTGEAHDRTLDAVERQIDAVADAVGPVTVAQAAVGGGTPTFLSAERLARALDLLRRFVDLRMIPWSIETSPATATPARLSVLMERGVQRVSMGVQSFVDEEVRGAGRPQRRTEVDAALKAIRDAGVPEFNLDLMYGLPHQTEASWQYSLDTALGWNPTELFLYPLYVRPRTGLDRTGRSWDDHRLRLYRIGRDHLLANGYRQFSMRRFRRLDAPEAPTEYRCQSDAMIGVGPGARSYTSGLHYSTEWGVGRSRVKEIVGAFHERTAEEHATAFHGVEVGRCERQRRHLMQSLLCEEGLQFGYYTERFGTQALSDWPQLTELVDLGLGEVRDGGLILTERGFERSDAVGRWLVSPAVASRMQAYVTQ